MKCESGASRGAATWRRDIEPPHCTAPYPSSTYGPPPAHGLVARCSGSVLGLASVRSRQCLGLASGMSGRVRGGRAACGKAILACGHRRWNAWTRTSHRRRTLSSRPRIALPIPLPSPAARFLALWWSPRSLPGALLLSDPETFTGLLTSVKLSGRFRLKTG